MTVKTVTIKGGALIDTDSEYSGWVADDTSGLHFVPDPNISVTQPTLSTLTYNVTETANPLWNQVNYKIDDNISFTSSGLSGHITLIGIDQMGIEHDIMQHRYASSESTSNNIKAFDLLQSACTGAAIKHITGMASAGTITVDIPKRYDKYESVTLKPSWFNNAWTKRKSLQIAKVEGYTHGSAGHNNDYYGITVGIPYDTDMNTDLSDIRFCAPDGVSIMPHYFIRNDTSKVAGTVGGAAVVLIPYQFIDSERNNMPIKADTTVSYNYPDYIYMYYGNSIATSTSDITLRGNTNLYDAFNTTSLNSKWTLTQTDPAKNTIAYSTTGITLGATNTITNPSEVKISADTGKVGRTDSFETIVKVVNNTALTTTEGFIMRFTGVTSGNYFETRSWLASPIDYGNGTSSRYAYSATFKAASGTTYTNFYQTAPAIVSTTPVYFKFRFNVTTTTTTEEYVAVYTSHNGYEWDYLGKMKDLGTAFTSGEKIRFELFYHGATATPQAGNIKVESIITYPIMADNGACWEDSFQDGYFINRYQTAFNGTTKTMTETGGYYQLATTDTVVANSEIAFENIYANQLSLLIPTGSATAVDNLGAWGDRIQYGTEAVADVIYETEIISQSTITGAGKFAESGLIYNAQTNSKAYSGGYGFMWGIRYSVTGASYDFVKTTWSSAGGGPTVTTTGTGIPWTAADMPIKLRVRINAFTGKVVGEYKKSGTSDEWLEGFTDSGGMWSSSYLGAGLGGFGIYIRGAKTTAVVRDTKFSYIRMDAGNGRILVDRPSEWRSEESYNLGIAPTTPNPYDMTLTFPSASIQQRNQPYTLTTKDFGGGYSNSKIFYLNEKDVISIGPDGIDKYIGMKLEFKFDFDSTDTFDVTEVNFIYEVI
jgi:hypothetical protein